MSTIETVSNDLILPMKGRMSLSAIDPDLEVFERIHLALQQHAGERGFNETADIITETADGISLNQLWREFATTIGMLNRDRTTWINRLTFRVANPVEWVSIPAGQVDFEEASEFGVPKGIRPATTQVAMGYPWKMYDLAVRYTWMFLAENTADQVRANNALALEASIRLQFTRVFRAIFNPTNEVANINDQPYNVYRFYNGDGTVPPAFKLNTFDGTHTHFLASGAATVDEGDIDDIYTHLAHHGYTMDRGYRHLLWVNEAQGNVIRAFRVATGATWDFIPGGPSVNGGVYLDDDGNRTLVGRPDLGNIPGTIGTYGPFVVIQDDYIPAGYIFAQAYGGENNIGNPVGIREHTNPALRGLRLVPGSQHDYPLVDSYYIQGMGAGVRHRGAGVVMQVTTNASYAPPAQYA